MHSTKEMQQKAMGKISPILTEKFLNGDTSVAFRIVIEFFLKEMGLWDHIPKADQARILKFGMACKNLDMVLCLIFSVARHTFNKLLTVLEKHENYIKQNKELYDGINDFVCKNCDLNFLHKMYFNDLHQHTMHSQLLLHMELFNNHFYNYSIQSAYERLKYKLKKPGERDACLIFDNEEKPRSNFKFSKSDKFEYRVDKFDKYFGKINNNNNIRNNSYVSSKTLYKKPEFSDKMIDSFIKALSKLC